MTKHLPDEAARGFPVGTLIDERYKIVRLIGQADTGLLHEVEHVRTGRRLALKTLRDRDDLGRMEDEARTASLLRNPHALKITDMGTFSNVGPYLVMDLVEGRSLRALLDEKPQLPVATAVNIALHVCECIDEAHGHGVVHRNLKPESVLVAPTLLPDRYDVKVLDFGAAQPARDAAPRVGAGDACCYASPEQLQGAPDVDARADVYALGVVLYECLAGRKPYEATTPDGVIRAISAGPPAQLGRFRPDAPAELCQVAMRALSVRREQRQQGMREIAAALLPYGDAALGVWLRGGVVVEERRPQIARPAAAPEATVRTHVGVDVRDDDRTAQPSGPSSSRDSDTTDPDAEPPDSDPITASWGEGPPRSDVLPGGLPPNGAWPGGPPPGVGAGPMTVKSASDVAPKAASWLPDARAAGEVKTRPPESRSDSERPTSAWNNSAMRGLGELDGPASPPPALFDAAAAPLAGPPPFAGPPWFGAAPPDAVAPLGARTVDAAFETTELAPIPAERHLLGIGQEPGRDTPTEMYRKSDQGPLPADSDGPGSLDRDTPSPAAGQPQFGPSPFTSGPMQHDGGDGRGSLPSIETLPTVPHHVLSGSAMDQAHSAIRLTSPPAFPRIMPRDDKPGWQRSLDRALVRVGDGIEHRVDQLRRASLAARAVLVLLGVAIVVGLVGGALYLVLG